MIQPKPVLGPIGSLCDQLWHVLEEIIYCSFIPYFHKPTLWYLVLKEKKLTGSQQQEKNLKDTLQFLILLYIIKSKRIYIRKKDIKYMNT